ncbi:hypothetical protein ACIGW8_02600 [Streptomyces sioyaensis]|uniref:hypothetical protein n=1 Tax=Streptomyces sioyaensis TaxID=67364 RepID=UPI0037CFB241
MHLRVQGTPQTGVDGAMSPLGGLRERRLLTRLPLNADRVVATSTLLADRRSATVGGLRARCRTPSPSARWVSG